MGSWTGGVWLGLLMMTSSGLLLLMVSGSPTPPPPPPPTGEDSSPSPSPSSCSSCSSSSVRINSSSSSLVSSDMVEAVKTHILSMLHLGGRPNLTSHRAVPRAALLNAIRKLQVALVGEDGSVEILRDGGIGGAEADPQPPEPPSEVITFAEPGNSSSSVTFDLSQEGGGSSVVEQASIWLFLKITKGGGGGGGSRSKGKVTISLLQVNHTQSEGAESDHTQAEGEELLVSEKAVDPRRSGWHTLPVPLGRLQALLDGGHRGLELRVSCPLCPAAGAAPVLAGAAPVLAGAAGAAGASSVRDQSHRPFLMMMLRAGGPDHSHPRAKRGLECDGKIRVCCKRQFYVNFKDIGWNDWIIAPPGYHANYCEGECPAGGHVAGMAPPSTLSFHSTVISHYRLRGYAPFQGAVRSCCIPTRLRAMSMLYYNEEQKIIKKDIHNMIVEECGCS